MMKEAARGTLKWLVRSKEPVGREGGTAQRTTHQAAARTTQPRIFLEAQNLCSGPGRAPAAQSSSSIGMLG